MAPPSHPRDTLLPGVAGRAGTVTTQGLSPRGSPPSCRAHPFDDDLFFVLDLFFLLSLVLLYLSGGTQVRGRGLPLVRGSCARRPGTSLSERWLRSSRVVIAGEF